MPLDLRTAAERLMDAAQSAAIEHGHRNLDFHIEKMAEALNAPEPATYSEDEVNYLMTRQQKIADSHKSKADQWLTAYQNERVKNVGDFARKFVVRKRLQRVVMFLMKL